MPLKTPKIPFWDNWKLIPAQRRWIRGWAYAEGIIHQVRLYPALMLILCICYCCYENTREARCLGFLRNTYSRQVTELCIDLVLDVERARPGYVGWGGSWKQDDGTLRRMNGLFYASERPSHNPSLQRIHPKPHSNTNMACQRLRFTFSHSLLAQATFFLYCNVSGYTLASRPVYSPVALCCNVSGDMFSLL